MKILILEDNPTRQEKFKTLFKNQDYLIVDNILDAMRACKCNDFKVMLLDHDLGNQIWVDSNEANTGYSFVKWLIGNQLQKDSLIYIHSMNPIGANLMLNLLLDNGYGGIWIPYHQLKF
jgi:hypothetical protein